MSDKQLSLFDNDDHNPENFFHRKRSWSASKHRLILKYLQSFCYNLGGDKHYQSKILNYVDGFAGTGKYDEGIGIEYFIQDSRFWQRYNGGDFLDTDGSPIIALKCAKIFRKEGRVNLRCFFVEADKKNNITLKNNCEAVDGDLDYKVYEPQDFGAALPKLLEDIEIYPTLFFLDIFAVKGITFEHLNTISNYLSRYKGELFLLFHNRTVARCAGQSTSKASTDKDKRAAKTYMRNLTTFLGEQSEEYWQEKWLKLKGEPQKFEQWALKYLKDSLLQKTKFKGISSFEIKENYRDNRPLYSIVVCSNHPRKAFGVFLNDLFCEENKLLFVQENEVDSVKNFLVKNFLKKLWEIDVQRKIEKMEEDIIPVLQRVNRKWQKVDEVITSVILDLDNLGYLKRTEYRKIIVKLHKERRLEAKNLGEKGRVTLKSLVRIVK